MRCRAVRPVVVLALLLLPSAARADRASAVRRLLDQGKEQAAREKCARWEAASRTDEPELREACAKADWPLAEERDSVVDWRAYRERWSGTSWEEPARIREAQAALRAVGERAPEADLLELAERYAGTPAEAGFRRMAADAALRDARTAEEAVGVARRYPDHPRLWSLVERFPEAFARVEVHGRQVDVVFDPPVPVPEDARIAASWVARTPDGRVVPWDEAAEGLLRARGVAPGVIAALPDPEVGPRLPVCWLPGQPPGWGPAVAVAIGRGLLVEPVDWDPGCGPDAPPVFLTLEGDRVVSLSLRPGHRVDPFAPAPEAPPRDVRAWLPPAGGAPVLDRGRVLVRAGASWLVFPLSGGPPWATGRNPADTAQPLGPALLAGGLPAGWTLEPSGTEIVARGPGAAEAAEWRLAAGEIRALPPLVQRVLGLVADAADAPRAPALGPDAGWQRTPAGDVQRIPPRGARIAGIYQLDPGDVEAALGVLAGIGVARDRVEPLDGWRADLDGDRVQEVLLRLLVDGRGALAIVDPIEAAPPVRVEDARVFLYDVPRVRADARVADTPFTFRIGDFVYFAWSGAEATGRTSRRHFLVVVRTDGPSFRVEDFELP